MIIIVIIVAIIIITITIIIVVIVIVVIIILSLSFIIIIIIIIIIIVIIIIISIDAIMKYLSYIIFVDIKISNMLWLWVKGLIMTIMLDMRYTYTFYFNLLMLWI